MGLRQRWLAFVFARGNKAYESKVEERKRVLIGVLRGTVVEIGPGAGANLKYLDAGVRWIGFEPNPHMRPNLVKEAERLGRTIDLRPGSGERMDLDDGAADAVVCTLVLCSVPDIDALLREVRRVLKPGGAFVFVEHVAAPRGTWLRRLQQLVKPLWRRVNDGCCPDRETWTFLERNFASVDLQHFRVRFPLVAPHIAGTARIGIDKHPEPVRQD